MTKVRDIIQGVLGDNWEKPAGPYVIMETADSILSALKEAGWVCVPVEPTEKMIEATSDGQDPENHSLIREDWALMIAATNSDS